MKKSDFKKKIAEEVQSGLRGFISNTIGKAQNLPNGSIIIAKAQVERWKKVLNTTHFKAPNSEKVWANTVADHILHVMELFKKKENKTPVDPRVNDVKKLFVEYCNNIKGYEPQIDHKIETKMIKTALEKYSVDEITDLFDWFMNSSRYEKFSCTIKTILSNGIINVWLGERG